MLASQSAYMALPPDTPGSALRGWARMISYINRRTRSSRRARSSTGRRYRIRRRATTPGSGSSRRHELSAGLARAHPGAAASPGSTGGQIVLVSDLRDPPEDLPKVSALRSRMRASGSSSDRHRRRRGARPEVVLRFRRRQASSRAPPTRCTHPDRDRRSRSRPSALAARPAGVALAMLLALDRARCCPCAGAGGGSMRRPVAPPARRRRRARARGRHWRACPWTADARDRAYARAQAVWQRASCRRDGGPGLGVRAGETILGLSARAEVQRAYERLPRRARRVIPGTTYPQTQARFDVVARLSRLRPSLGRADRAALDVVLGVVLADSARAPVSSARSSSASQSPPSAGARGDPAERERPSSTSRCCSARRRRGRRRAPVRVRTPGQEAPQGAGPEATRPHRRRQRKAAGSEWARPDRLPVARRRRSSASLSS